MGHSDRITIRTWDRIEVAMSRFLGVRRIGYYDVELSSTQVRKAILSFKVGVSVPEQNHVHFCDTSVARYLRAVYCFFFQEPVCILRSFCPQFQIAEALDEEAARAAEWVVYLLTYFRVYHTHHRSHHVARGEVFAEIFDAYALVGVFEKVFKGIPFDVGIRARQVELRQLS